MLFEMTNSLLLIEQSHNRVVAKLADNDMKRRSGGRWHDNSLSAPVVRFHLWQQQLRFAPNQDRAVRYVCCFVSLQNVCLSSVTQNLMMMYCSCCSRHATLR